jgi:hypothetical protein
MRAREERRTRLRDVMSRVAAGFGRDVDGELEDRGTEQRNLPSFEVNEGHRLVARTGATRGAVVVCATWLACGTLACGARVEETGREPEAQSTNEATNEATREAPPAPTATAPRIRAVSIHVQPADGGSAHCRYERDGTVRGGHVSGGPSPFVHQDEGTIAPEIQRAIVGAAEATLAEPRPSPGVAPGAGTERIEIELEDGALVTFAWPFAGAHDDARVVALAGLLRGHRVGGW